MSKIITIIIGFIGLIGGIYLFASQVRKSEEPFALILKWCITLCAFLFWIYLGIQAQIGTGLGVLAPGLAAGTAVIVGILWTPNISRMLTDPLTKWYDGGDEQPELRPLYSIAEAYRKRGNYQRAVAEVHRQLVNFPEDYQGWLLLAEIQAENLRDVEGAIETMERILSFESVGAKNGAAVLGRVADWELARGNRDAAQTALERIQLMYPGTAEAQIAAQRIAHIASPEDLADMQNPRVIALKHSDEKIGLRIEPSIPPPEETPADVARRYLDHLQTHPLDNEIREKLALVYANDFQRLDLAIGELEQLITTPNQQPKNVVRWLNLMADIQIRLGAGIEAARQTLERIVELYPKSAAANTATVRLSQLRLELNQVSKQRTVKMGHYEQNIGLRKMNSSGTREDPSS